MNPDPVLNGSGSESGMFAEVGSGSGPNRSGSATLDASCQGYLLLERDFSSLNLFSPLLLERDLSSLNLFSPLLLERDLFLDLLSLLLERLLLLHRGGQNKYKLEGLLIGALLPGEGGIKRWGENMKSEKRN